MVVEKKKYKAETVRLAFSQYFVGDEHDGEQRMFCPVCEDPNESKSPSASMNPERGVWNCLKGNHGGSIVHLVRDLKEERGFDIRAAAMKGRHSDPNYRTAVQQRLNSSRSTTPLPTDEKIQEWVERLVTNKAVLKTIMEARGLERRTLVDFEIGWDGERYTIPVRDDKGELINVRRYKLGAEPKYKMLNWTGHGSAALYRPDILAEHEEIVITEGEMDCIILNQEGIPAVTHTGGASTFRPAWASKFIDKYVWICYDNDDAGRKGAKKVEQILAAFAKAIYIIDIGSMLPVKGADVTDYLHKEGHTASEFQALMEVTREARGTLGSAASAPLPIAGERMSLNESMAQANQSKTIELVVSIAGKQAEPYTAPKLVTATCDQSKGAACTLCPIAARNGQAEFELRQDDDQLFRFVDVAETRRKTLLREVTGARCSDRVEFEVDEIFHVEELLVQPSVDDRSDDQSQEPVRRTAFSVSTHASTVNRKVKLVGKNVPDPKTGKLRFMGWVNEPVEMDIDKFDLTEDVRDQLAIFQPEDDQSPLDKAIEIAQDMAENVTHIYGRDLLHVANDLVWHSVLAFRIGDMVVDKGWLEMMVVGDTRTGKSEVSQKLLRHYRSGVWQSCEGMSFAGIVGGVQQIDGRWHMTWGVVPMNDRRLVVLDEVSGLDQKNVIEQMSSIRSSGVAQITKIASEETSARTRCIWLTNAADGSMIKDNPQAGVGALRTVVPNSEDIARFDFVMATAKDEVDSKLINSSFSEGRSPLYSSEDCETLVKWVWSLTRNNVTVTDEAGRAAVEQALKMGERYISDPPLVQAENVRFKILRIAAALAARTFSVHPEENRLIVTAAHVNDAVRFLDMVYEQESMGYARASKRHLAQAQRAKEKYNLCVSFLREHPDDVLLTLRMVGGNNFRTRDFEDHGGMDKAAAKAVVKTLLTWNVIHLKSRGDIGMDPILIKAIRELEDEL